MFLRLAVLFVTVPLAELAILVWIGQHVGVLPTVALIFLTGLLGASLARWQGLRTWRRFQEAVNAGRMPHRELLEGLLILIAGAVLLTPGLLTDLAGFALLVPQARGFIAATLGRRLGRHLRVVTTTTAGAPRGRAAGEREARTYEVDGDDDVVDVDFAVVEGNAVEGDAVEGEDGGGRDGSRDDGQR